MSDLPTDMQILEEIYRCYYDVFSSFSKDDPSRKTKNFVPIDIESIANRFTTDADIVFGRLYYHLDKKHGYKQEDGNLVRLFSNAVDKDIHCVHFPLLASVLAGMRENKRRLRWSNGIAIAALIVSVVSLIFATQS